MSGFIRISISAAVVAGSALANDLVAKRSELASLACRPQSDLLCEWQEFLCRDIERLESAIREIANGGV